MKYCLLKLDVYEIKENKGNYGIFERNLSGLKKRIFFEQPRDGGGGKGECGNVKLRKIYGIAVSPRKARGCNARKKSWGKMRVCGYDEREEA